MSEQPLIASRYRVVHELGRGGMGVVLLVEHARTGEQFALKLLHGAAACDPQTIERFKREARASSRIKSEHVVKIIDADVAPEIQNAPFLVMELLNGTDMKRQVETSGRLSAADVVRYMTQASRALDKSHAIGIVHRDLKPENLFVHHREDGSTILKILDFGISKILGGEGGPDLSGAGLTMSGSIMGTPLYMAPEQARGRVNEIAPATDVWAMGLIVLNLLTGDIYWRANTMAELMVQILSEPLYPPSQRWAFLPIAIDDWFARACARDPKQRFQSVGQQVQELAAALALPAVGAAPAAPVTPHSNVVGVGSGPTTSSPPGFATTGATSSEAKTPKGSTRNVTLLVTGAVLLLAGAGSAAWLAKVRGDVRERAEQIASSAATSVEVGTIVPSSAAAVPTAAPAVASASTGATVGLAGGPSAVAAPSAPPGSAVVVASPAVVHPSGRPGLGRTRAPVRTSGAALPPTPPPASLPAPAAPPAPTPAATYNPVAP